MAKSKSSKDVFKEHIEVLGPDLGKLFHQLWNEFNWMLIKWQEYKELYSSSSERVALLNSASSLFFKIVQHSLWEDILLSLSRMTDPPKSMGKENLTFNSLPGLIIDEDFRKTLEELLKQAKDAVKFARDWRNRRLAHRDLKLALGDEINLLIPATRIKVANGISSLHKILDVIYQKYFKSKLIAEVITHNGAEELLYIIRDGINSRKAKYERLKSGKLIDDDIQPIKPI